MHLGGTPLNIEMGPSSFWEWLHRFYWCVTNQVTESNNLKKNSEMKMTKMQMSSFAVIKNKNGQLRIYENLL